LRVRQYLSSAWNLSLPTQLRACEEYCRRHGDEVLERFHEEGTKRKRRPLTRQTHADILGPILY
jgi:hypothetical protein